MEDLGWTNADSSVNRPGSGHSSPSPIHWPFSGSESQVVSPGGTSSVFQRAQTSTPGQTPQPTTSATQNHSSRDPGAEQRETEASALEQDFDPLPSQLVAKERGAAKSLASPAGQTGNNFSLYKPSVRVGQKPRSGIDLGLGLVLPIPPLYDELAKGRVWPSLEELRISDGVLKGPITTVTLASLKNATLEKQMGKPWACFSKGSLGYDPHDFKPLSFWSGEGEDEAANAASWFHSDWAFHSEKSPKKTSKKRVRGNKVDGAGNDRKKKSKATVPPAEQSTPPAAEEEGSMLGEEENKQEKSEEVVKHKKRESKFVEGWETLEFDKITSKQRSILKKAAVTNPDIRERLEASEARKHWGLMIRRDLPKTFKAWQTASKKQVQDARKLAEMCRREVRQRAARNSREAAKATHVMKKMCRDMLTFWRKADREAADIKKQEEKAAAEQRKREEEETEQRRQAQKLNFLLNKTELYSHFMANKLGGESAASVLPTPVLEDEEDAALLKEAKIQAEAAVVSTTERMEKFDKEYQEAHLKAGGGGGSSLINPSSMPSTSKVQQPKGFKGKLKEYQLRGLQWLVNLYEKGLNGILADEMGLGKTIQAIAFMAHLAEEKNIWGPFLVVAPSSTLHNWDSELSQFFPSFKVLPYWGSQQDRKVLRQSFNPRKMYSKEPPFNVMVTSYQLLIQDEPYLKRPKWQYMILDEAQAIKSSSSVRWKTLLSFSCRNRILLTGTPIQNNLAELWALLHFIMPTLFDSMEQFNDWFSKGLEQFAEGSHELNKEQLKRLHSLLSPFMLRRVKSDVAGEMVSKHEKVVFCDLSRRQRMLYTALRENLNLAHLFDSDDKVVNLMNLVIQLRKVCNHPELFEEQSERVPLHFAHQACPLSPAAFGSLSWVYYSGNRPELSFELPKLVFREGVASGQSAMSGWKDGFREKWLHNRLCIFQPANVLESMGQGGCFGFVGISGLSPNKVHFMSVADPLQRWVHQMQQHRNDRTTAGFWERHWTAKSQGRVYALRSNRILLVDVHAATDSLREIPDSADCVGCGPLVRGAEERMLGMLDILKRLRPGFVEPVLAPAPEILCSDRSFASRMHFWHSSAWLTSLLFGNSPADIDDVRFTAGAPSAIREVTSRILTGPPAPPLVSSLHRAFGSAPPMQQYALAKALVDSGKMFKLDGLLRKLKAAGHRVLLFSQMTMMMNILADYLNFRRYRYLRLDGQSSISDRRDMVNAFQQDPKIFVFLLSTRAGGLGINLTAADTVIFFESDWNPTMDLQAMDRAHRLGQTRDVTVYRLICRGTIEEKILQRAKEKKTVQQLVMTGQASKGDLFAPEEMVSLLLEEGEAPVSINRYGRKQSKAALEMGSNTLKNTPIRPAP
ncbi:hypothetical protein BSKO_06891 [Bryopsis sp. KO-2023]|nr:hypothetical protein BSKO_06891 [Bryopsis sp. KO-2023]